MVTPRLFRWLRKLIQTEATLAQAADKAGVDEKTARKYRDSDPLSSQRCVPLTWRTREDPFLGVWPEFLEKLRPSRQTYRVRQATIRNTRAGRKEADATVAQPWSKHITIWHYLDWWS